MVIFAYIIFNWGISKISGILESVFPYCDLVGKFIQVIARFGDISLKMLKSH